MPNWCTTDYVVAGDKKQVRKLFDTMRELEDMPEPGLHENDFGSMWMGNLVIKLGGDWQKIRCRGSWGDMELDEKEGKLRFWTETAWCEMAEWRHFIKRKFSKLEIYFYAEEGGCGIYETNDSEGLYFTAEYHLYDEKREDDNYYQSLEELTKDIENLLGVEGLNTFDDCNKALENYASDHDDFCFSLDEIKIVDN